MTEPVYVDLGDGKQRELKYTLATLRRLKAKFGKSALTGELLRSLDEDSLPDVIFEGLVDKSGIKNADALAEMITPAQSMGLVQAFTSAYTGSFPTPDPNAPGSQPTQN